MDNKSLHFQLQISTPLPHKSFGIHKEYQNITAINVPWDFTALYTFYYNSFQSSDTLPFFWDSLCDCATFPGCVDDLDVIWGKLNQVSQGT